LIHFYKSIIKTKYYGNSIIQRYYVTLHNVDPTFWM